MELFLVIALAATGLCVGSFLNVVAYRLPAGRSIVTPASACPGCGTAIAPYDNLPVISWLALRGHCRSCDAGISARYPLTEAATGILFALAVLATGADPKLCLDLVFIAVLVAVTRIDLEHLIIPDRIVGPFAVAAVALTAVFTPHELPARLIAAAIGGGAFCLISLVYPRGLGMGDAKLVAAMGLVLGASLAPALFVAVLAGTLTGGVMMALGQAQGRGMKLPFGPFLAFGGLVGLFAGPAIVHAYLGMTRL